MRTLTALGPGSMAGRRTVLPFVDAAVVLMAGVALFVALVPSYRLVPGLSRYDGHRVLELGLLLLNAGLLLFARRLRADAIQVFRDFPPAVRAMTGGMFALGAVSAVRAPVPRYALLEVALYALLFCLALAVAAAQRRDSKTGSRVLLALVSAGVALYVTNVAVSYAFALARGAEVWPREHLGFVHLRHFNQFQTWTLPLVVLPALLLKHHSKVLGGLMAVLAALWWMLLFASGGRGTALSFAVAFGFTLLVFGRAARGWAFAQLASMAAGAAFFFLFFQVLVPGQDSFLGRDLTTDSDRFLVWGHAWAMAARHPLLGIGPMHLAYAPPGGDNVAHPHNLVLQWAAEWGLPATVLLVAVGLWGVWRWVGFARRDHHAHPLVPHRHYLVALTATLVAAGGHSLLCGVAVMPFSQVLFAVVAGWVVGLYQQAEIPPARFGPRHARLHTFGAGLWLALAVGIAAWGVAPDVFRLDERQARFVEATDAEIVYPRFWLQGYIRDATR